MRKISILLTILITSFVMTLAGLVAGPIATASETETVRISAAFPFGSPLLTDTQKTVIKQAVTTSGTDITFVVTGAAGKIPGVSDEAVRTLATKRAQAVESYLVKLGVNKASVTTKVNIARLGIVPKTKIVGSVAAPAITTTPITTTPAASPAASPTFASSYLTTWDHNDGASETAGPTTYTTGASIYSLPKTTAKSGFLFAGWYVDAGFSGTSIDATYTPATPYGDVTFYAKWNALTINAITWNRNDGVSVVEGPTSYTSTESIVSLPITTKTGYDFAGWYDNAEFSGTAIDETYTPATPHGDITIYAKWAVATQVALACADGGTCVVGNTGPGGGIVYYVDTSGFSCGSGYTTTGSPTGGLCKYLEVAPSGWNNGGSTPATDPKKLWAVSGKQYSNVAGIKSDVFSPMNRWDKIGLGYKHSVLIVTQNGAGTSYAAGAARAYAGNSKSDWYLPTTAELNLLCRWNRGVARIVTNPCTGGTLNKAPGASAAGFVAMYYWSSSQEDSNSGWASNFNQGYQNSHQKNLSNYVRPIRAF